MELHPILEAACGQLIRDSRYSEAVQAGLRALDDAVRRKSGAEEFEGRPLMVRAFGTRMPLLRFNPLADQADIDEQRRFMMLFAGAAAGLNPQAAHTINENPERAREYIDLLSMLAGLLDQAERSSE